MNPWENGSVDGHRGFQPFNAFTGENIGGAQITVVDGAIPMSTVDAASGIAIDPLSGTAYVLLKGGFSNTQLPRVLATLDLASGEATTLGNTTKPLTNLAFGNGVLYGTGGRSGKGYSEVADDPAFGHLFTISTANGSIIDDLGQLTNCPGITAFDSCGHAIAFNSDDGELYHMSGPEENQIFERVVLSPSFALEPLTYSSSTKPDMVLGMGWDTANDRFIMTDWLHDAFSVTVDGSDEAFAFALPEVRQGMKGLAISTDPVPTDTPPVAVDDVFTVDEGDGSVQFDVLANDINPDAGAEFIQSVEQPANGSVGIGSINNAPMLFYTPDPAYCNDGSPTDDFNYTLNGGSTAVVEVTVNCIDFTGPLVFGVYPSGNGPDPHQGGLKAFDAANGLVEHERFITANHFGSAVTGDVKGGRGLAVRPTDGVVFALLRMNTVDEEVLATIDPLTGDAVTIGNTRHSLVGMTFDNKGRLYAISDTSDPTCETCLFTLSTSTGAAKTVKRLVPDFGDAIAFNPVDKKIYRATASLFQTIDPSRSFAVKNVGYGGLQPGSPIGMGYDPQAGVFRLTSDELWSVNPIGGAFVSSDMDWNLHGVVVSEPTLTLKYSSKRRRFSGDLMTPMASDCDASRTVSIWRDVDGPDQLIGTPTTGPDGAFTLAMRAKRGKYFATVADAPPANDLPCPDARSLTRTVS